MAAGITLKFCELDTLLCYDATVNSFELTLVIVGAGAVMLFLFYRFRLLK